MMRLLGFITRQTDRFRRDEAGAVLAETIIVMPVIALFAAGLLQFGSILWQRQEMETGLRDAARYLARCRPSSALFPATCSDGTAQNIAIYGNSSGTGALRLPGWTSIVIDKSDPTVIRVDGSYDHDAFFGNLTISAFHEERYIGW